MFPFEYNKRKKGDKMPKLGDIIRGNKIIGYKDYGKCIWSACSVCGKERWVKLDKNGKPIHKKCGSCGKKGKNNPHWKGGKYAGKERCIWVRVESTSPFFKMRNCQNYIEKHRLVMAEYLGRCLTSEEIVHHINGIKSDNRIENLMLMSVSEHNGLTQRERKRKKEARNKEKQENSITINRKGYQARYYKNNIEKLKKYKELWYTNKHKKEKT